MAHVYSRILVGFDGSPSAAHALGTARRVAGPDGEVLALAVVVPAGHAETVGGRSRAADAARTQLEERFARVTDDGVAVVPRLKIVEAREVAETIARYAEEHGYDLVVLGRHGTEGVVHPQLGHIVRALVRVERLAVLLCPEPP